MYNRHHISHSAKGSVWKKHKYISKINGVYKYAKDTAETLSDVKEKTEGTINNFKRNTTKVTNKIGKSISKVGSRIISAPGKAAKTGWDYLKKKGIITTERRIESVRSNSDYNKPSSNARRSYVDYVYQQKNK